jgi:hypothetical protein
MNLERDPKQCKIYCPPGLLNIWHHSYFYGMIQLLYFHVILPSAEGGRFSFTVGKMSLGDIGSHLSIRLEACCLIGQGI